MPGAIIEMFIRKLVGVFHGFAVEFQNDVAVLEAGLLRRDYRRSRSPTSAPREFLHAERLGNRRGDILRKDAEVGAGHFTVLQDLVHDVAGQVHGDCKSNALAAFRTVGDDGGVDADQLAAIVDQRAAGVAGIDGRVGLDEVFIGFDAQVGTAGGADDSHGHGLADAKGVADCERVVANLNFRRIADHDGRQVRKRRS